VHHVLDKRWSGQLCGSRATPQQRRNVLYVISAILIKAEDVLGKGRSKYGL
jgi:hypothetical protein